MAKSDRGKKHPLLLYRRTMDRVWGITLLLGGVLFALWWFGGAFTSLFRPQMETLVLAAAVIALGVGAFAFAARRLGYVQAHASYFLIATPFFRLKTSYRRVRGVRTMEFFRMFDVDNLNWAMESYVKPFVGESMVVVSVADYPMPPNLIKLFFPDFIMSPRDTEFALLVPDWMALSVELDSRLNEYRRRARKKGEQQGFKRGMYR
jgi:hypothetical protein